MIVLLSANQSLLLMIYVIKYKLSPNFQLGSPLPLDPMDVTRPLFEKTGVSGAKFFKLLYVSWCRQTNERFMKCK
jgi:hypothetical protein